MAATAPTQLSAAIHAAQQALVFASPSELAERDAAVARAQAEERRALRRQRLDRARPPVTAEDYRRIVDGTLDANAFVAAVDAALAGTNPASVLVLLGTNGVGKTVAAAHGIANRGGTWAHAADLVRICDSYSQEERRRGLERAAVLLLDEVGLETKPDEFCARLCQLIDARKGPGMLTVLTANMAPRAFRQRYEPHERLWSRLAQVARTVQVAGDDMRRAQ